MRTYFGKIVFVWMVLVVGLFAWSYPVRAQNQVNISTDLENSEAIYVIQFTATLNAKVDKIVLDFPPTMMDDGPVLYRVVIGPTVRKATGAVDPLDANRYIVDLNGAVGVKNGTKFQVEMLKLRNLTRATYPLDITLQNTASATVDTIPTINFSISPQAVSGSGDITAVNTTAGSGLIGGAATGDVNLSVDFAPVGGNAGTATTVARSDHTHAGTGDITSVNTAAGSGLIGGVATGDVNLSVDFAPAGGSAGTATTVARSDHTHAGDITSVVAGTGLTGGATSGDATLDVSFAGPGAATTAARSDHDHSLAGLNNTAIGATALDSNTGSNNTAVGTNALTANTTGESNTASGDSALFSNTSGGSNTASGGGALFANTTGIRNTASGNVALASNTTGGDNTASGTLALANNTTGSGNTASGISALANNTIGSNNTAIGAFAEVFTGNLTNATAIGANAFVNASNKVRIGDTNVAVIEGQVDWTFTSDATKKENFRPVDGEEVLKKLRELKLTSWNYIGHDPKQYRHYGPMAQDFFAAFGNDGVGAIGTPTTLRSGDVAGILVVAVQALEKQNAELKARLDALESLVRDRSYRTVAVESMP